MIIDPDGFGCSSKLTFAETVDLATIAKGSMYLTDFDFIEISDAQVLMSTDQIFRCSSDWDIFADIAISHAVADVVVGGATPSSLSISFAFGPDTQINLTEDLQKIERQLATQAFHNSAKRMKLAVGKCHSVFTNDPTNVTISSLGIRQAAFSKIPKQGAMFLGDKIGSAKSLYMSEIGLIATDTVPVKQLRSISRPVATEQSAFHTDVSGHGLAGAVLLACLQNGWDANLILDTDCTISTETVGYAVGCLQNSLDSYGSNFSCVDTDAETVCALRETSGPILSFVEGAQNQDYGFPCVGYFTAGNGKVSASWRS
jgi:hypothetical protein